MNSRLNKKRRAGSFLAIFLVLMLMLNIVMPSKTYAAPAPIERLVNEALELTGMKDLVDDVAELLEDTLNGTLPVVKEIPQILIEKAKETAEEAVAQLSVIMPILQKVAETGDVVSSVLGYLPDFDVDFSLPVPAEFSGDIGARAWAKKDDDILSLCVWLDGPGKSQLVFGISNEDPLGDGNALHFENPNKITTAFFDITPNGQDYVHARLPLGMDMPTIYAMGYIPWPPGNNSEQYIKVEIGAMTDTKVNLNFEVSLKATADAEVSIEGEAKASFSVEVSPREAQKLSNLTMIAMNNALKNEVEKGELGPQAAANIINAAINEFNIYSSENPGAIGSISLGVDIAGMVGLGILDTAWPGI